MASARVLPATSAPQTSGSTKSRPSTRSARRAPRPGASNAPRDLADGNQILSGTDLVLAESFSQDELSLGKVLWSRQLAPAYFGGSRLKTSSGIYSRWRPRSLVLRLSTGVGSLVGGKVGLGWDASHRPISGEGFNAVRQVLSMQPSSDANLSSEARIVIPCGQDSRNAIWFEMGEGHGTFYSLITAIPSNVTGDLSFRLELDWEVEFSSPQLSESAQGIPSHLFAQDGKFPYYTDSSNQWFDGAMLSLKHKAGEEFVPFGNELKLRTVYSLDSTYHLPYYKAGETSEGRIRYGVAIPNGNGGLPYGRALAVFASISKARGFAASGDPRFLMPYYKAGKFGGGPTGNPPWFEIGQEDEGSDDDDPPVLIQSGPPGPSRVRGSIYPSLSGD